MRNLLTRLFGSRNDRLLKSSSREVKSAAAFESGLQALSDEALGAKSAEFRPRFETADADNDSLAYRRALRDFIWSIPDGHLSGPFIREDFIEGTRAGIGLAIRDLEDGRTIANFVTPDGPGARAGIEVGAEILTWNGQPIDDYVASIVPFSSPFSGDHVRRLQQLRYATRAPLDSEVEITFKNPDSTTEQTAVLTAVEESESFRVSSFNIGRTGAELPVEFRLLDNGLGYVKIYSFSDNDLLTVQLRERMLETLNQNSVPGLIIDMRQNGGGSGFLADQMAAYFFNEPLELGKTGYYDESLGEFYFDPDRTDRFYLPDESLRYAGPVAVITGPNCASACEFFSHNMTLQGRADVVANYPTAGLGGAQKASVYSVSAVTSAGEAGGSSKRFRDSTILLMVASVGRRAGVKYGGESCALRMPIDRWIWMGWPLVNKSPPSRPPG